MIISWLHVQAELSLNEELFGFFYGSTLKSSSCLSSERCLNKSAVR